MKRVLWRVGKGAEGAVPTLNLSQNRVGTARMLVHARLCPPYGGDPGR
jgi:hypothetical protein